MFSDSIQFFSVDIKEKSAILSFFNREVSENFIWLFLEKLRFFDLQDVWVKQIEAFSLDFSRFRFLTVMSNLFRADLH